MIRFSGVKAGEACTIVLRGSSSHLLDEAERSLHDALCVLIETIKESSIVFGGGCSECLMANAVDEEARKTPGKRQLAMEAFARALRQLPTIIADNAGYDSAELVAMVRAAHAAGDKRAGLDVRTGIVGNMQELGITEALKLKRQVLLSASEAAEMMCVGGERQRRGGARNSARGRLALSERGRAPQRPRPNPTLPRAACVLMTLLSVRRARGTRMTTDVSGVAGGNAAVHWAPR